MMQDVVARTRRPICSGLALVIAIGTAILSVLLYTGGLGSGFEGFGPMLMGIVTGVIGAPIVVLLSLAGQLRKERPVWMAVLPIAISLANIVWLLAVR